MNYELVYAYFVLCLLTIPACPIFFFFFFYFFFLFIFFFFVCVFFYVA
jgi:hypothetical protein